jgi:hypothetical protein
MLAKPLHKAWATIDPMLAHFVQLLDCRLLMRFPMYLMKCVEICFDFLYVHLHVKHGIVTFLVRNKM